MLCYYGNILKNIIKYLSLVFILCYGNVRIKDKLFKILHDIKRYINTHNKLLSSKHVL